MLTITKEKQCSPRKFVVNFKKIYWYEIGNDGLKYSTNASKDVWAAIKASYEKRGALKEFCIIFVKSEAISWMAEE